MQQYTAKKLKNIKDAESFLDVRQPSEEAVNQFMLPSAPSKQVDIADMPTLQNDAVAQTVEPQPPKGLLFLNMDEEVCP